MVKRIEKKLQQAAYEEALLIAEMLLDGRKTKEAFAKEQAKERLENFKDPLTTLFNRNFFDQVVRLMITLARRHQEPLTFLMLDLDNFKGINDQFGHLVGDRVLAGLGKIVKESIRVSDIASRYGGEEIAILLPVTQEKAAEEVARRLLRNIADKEFKVKGKKIRMTASIGFASLEEKMKLQDLINHADKALYQAKKLGKNRFEKYG